MSGTCARLRRGLAHGIALAVASYTPLAAAQANQIRDTYGEVGLLDMPSAHMADDGQLAFVFGDIEHTEHFNIDFQALPWLESSFRFSHVAAGSEVFDRSFGAKVRLFTEQNGIADISVGMRDLLGTGVYSSEYLVASRHFDTFDLTAGFGWGRLAAVNQLPNPFGEIFSSFKTRSSRYSANGGTINFGQFFHGPKVGLFGGASWETPIDGLSLIAEYSTDKYTNEMALSPKTFPIRSPVNLGASYQISPSLSAAAGWYYGSSYGVTLTLKGDPTTELASNARVGPVIPPPAIRSEAQQRQSLALLLARNSSGAMWTPPNEADRARLNLNQALLSEGRGVRDIDLESANLMIDAPIGDNAAGQCASYAKIAAVTGTRATSVAMSDLEDGDGEVVFCPITIAATRNQPSITQDFERSLQAGLREQNLRLAALSIGTSELWLYYDNPRYRGASEAAGRVIRILMRDAPPSVELFHIFPLTAGRPGQEIMVTRSTMERALQDAEAPAELAQAVSLQAAPLNNPVLARADARNYPSFNWSVVPGLGEQVFDPDRPLQLMLYGDATAGVALAPGLTLGTELTAILWDDYTLNRPSGSVLPHVRTDLLKYIKQGGSGISYLGAQYETRLAPDLFAKAKIGYLEDMYAGAGGELLWRPEGSRFAIGADAYQVWKRDFNRLFGVQSYNIATGHVSVYYDSPWYGLNFAVHGGRYLASDYGATFEIKRRFSTGVEVGAFATFTNVPFSRFGEGSFDKGITIRIPMEWALPIFTQTTYNLDMHSLNRDGGQRLSNDDSLYDETQSSSFNDLTQDFDGLIRP